MREREGGREGERERAGIKPVNENCFKMLHLKLPKQTPF